MSDENEGVDDDPAPVGGSLTDVISEEMDEATGERILVRSTANLSGLKLGQNAWVDPSDPEIARLLSIELLVPVESAEPEN